MFRLYEIFCRARVFHSPDSGFVLILESQQPLNALGNLDNY